MRVPTPTVIPIQIQTTPDVGQTGFQDTEIIRESSRSVDVKTLPDQSEQTTTTFEDKTLQQSVKQESVSFHITKHYGADYKPAGFQVPEPHGSDYKPIGFQVPPPPESQSIIDSSSITKQSAYDFFKTKLEEAPVPEYTEYKPVEIIHIPEQPPQDSQSIIDSSSITKQSAYDFFKTKLEEVPEPVVSKPEPILIQGPTITDGEDIDSSSITKQSAYEFFKTKLEENLEPQTTEREHLPELVQKSYKAYEKSQSVEDTMPKEEVHEVCTQIILPPKGPVLPPIENILRPMEPVKPIEEFQLVPEPPPEMGFMPQSAPRYQRQSSISDKIKNLQTIEQEPSEVPQGGIKLFPSMKDEKLSIYRTQADLSTRPLSPRPSAEAIEMEKLWVPRKSLTPEPQSLSYEDRPISVASHSSFETMSFNRSHSEMSGALIEKPSSEGVAMDKMWAHKHPSSQNKIWPPPETEITSVSTPWSDVKQETKTEYSSFKETKSFTTPATTEYSSFKETNIFATPTPPPPSAPIQHYVGGTSSLEHKVNIPVTQTQQSTFSEITKSNETIIEERNIKPSDVKKTLPGTPFVNTYDLKSPSIVRKVETPKPLEMIRPVSVQDITDEIYLQPGSPPEIAFAEPPTERRLSYVGAIEEELQQTLEKVPTKVLPNAVRTIPPPPLPPRKEKLAAPPPLPAKPKPVTLEPFPYKLEPEAPKQYVPPPPKPSKFVKGQFTESDYECDYITPKPEFGYRSVRPPSATLPRSRSMEPEPIPPSKFERPSELRGPSPSVFTTITPKVIPKPVASTLPRSFGRPKPQKPKSPPLNLQPGPQPQYLQTAGPKPQDSGYMADTEEPRTQQSVVSQHTISSSTTEKKFYSKHQHVNNHVAPKPVVQKQVVQQKTANQQKQVRSVTLIFEPVFFFFLV